MVQGLNCSWSKWWCSYAQCFKRRCRSPLFLKQSDGLGIHPRSNLAVDFITILWRQPQGELVPWERSPWHWSKHVKFRPSWLFQKGCLSLHSWQTAMLAHVGTEWHILVHVWHSAFSTFHWFYQVRAFENSPWASLGRILVHNHRITLMSTKAWGKLSLGKPATITFGENKDVNSSIKFRL